MDQRILQIIQKHPELKSEFEEIYPELKESKDERIRKFLINLVNDGFTCFPNGLMRRDVLAYLEKQKTSEEAIKYVKENHSPDEISDFQAAMNIAVAKAYDKGVQDTLEKQKEQPKKELGKYLDEDNLAYRLNWVMQDYIKEGKDGEEKMHRYKCYNLFWDALEDSDFFERQKDASKAIEAVDQINKYIDERSVDVHDMKDSNPDKMYYNGWDDALAKISAILQDAYSDEKQKELSELEQLAKLREMTHEIREAYERGIEVGRAELKPTEWSEEDEACLEYALWCVMKTRHFVAKDACDLDTCQRAERWLKSLPERFNLQPRQEWDEEDEKIWQDIFELCNRFGYDDACRKLKSLRTQPHWKPSEEHPEIDLKKFTEKMDAWKAMIWFSCQPEIINKHELPG